MRITSGVGVGAVTSQVISSTAFADHGSPNNHPVTSGNLSVVVTVSNSGQTATVGISGLSASCSSPPSAARVDRWIEKTPGFTPNLFQFDPAQGTSFAPNAGSTPTSLLMSFDIEATDGSGGTGASTKLARGQVISMDLHVRMVCRRPDGGAAWTCTTYRIVITFGPAPPPAGTASSGTATVTVLGTTVANCGGPPAVVAP
jgi:hypothetical protein